MTPKTIAIHTHNARMTMDGIKAGLIFSFGGSRVVNGLVGPIGAVESEVVNSGGQVKGDLNKENCVAPQTKKSCHDQSQTNVGGYGYNLQGLNRKRDWKCVRVWDRR